MGLSEMGTRESHGVKPNFSMSRLPRMTVASSPSSGQTFLFPKNGRTQTLIDVLLRISRNGGFPRWGVPQNGWLLTEDPSKMDDLGVPLF